MALRTGDRVAGKYRIEKLLDEGGMGAVYVAENERLGKRVALKVLGDGLVKDGSVDRFVREATAASSLKHPGIVEIHDADVHEGTPWIAMELLEGETLAARIGRAALPVDEALDVVLEALAAIGAVHAAGIVHRDLKPENLFLEQLPGGGRRVKVLDFGVARGLGPMTAGPHFLAPERAMNAPLTSIDARADVYAIGAILFYALAWQLPYQASSFAELVRQMQTSGPRKLGAIAPHVPPAIAAIVDRCLSVDPALRPASAGALAAELERARGPMGATPKTMTMSVEELAATSSTPGLAGSASWQAPPPYGSPPLGPFHAPPPRSGGGGGVVAIVAIVALAVIVLPALLGALGAAFFWMRSRSAPEPVEVTSSGIDMPIAGPSLSALDLPGADAARSRVEVPPRAPRRGPDDALVTIVMFSDYQCPFCNRVEPTLARLRETYGTDLRIVWRDNPLAFHTDAMPAAELAREAYAQGGDLRYWPLHDLLFANQQALDRASLERYAGQAGLDLARVRTSLDVHTHQTSIQADMAAATRVGARGTPSFFINGRSLAGAQPYEQFDTIVSEEMALARALVAGGTPRASLYSRFLEGATDGPPPEAPAPAPSPRAQPDPSAVYRVPLGDSPQQGPADALVTVVAISEFQCPFCARVSPTLEQLREHYGDDLRIVFKHNPLPFHTNAMPAAEAAIEVYTQRGAPAFWRYHDTLFENGQQLTRENLERWAQQLGGIDMTRFRAALDDHRHQARIRQDQDLASAIGATGTPTFFINGRNLRGAQPFEAFRTLIDEELTRARAEVARGTPRAQVYEALTRDGHTTPQVLAAPAAPAPSAQAEDAVYAIAVPENAPSRGPHGARVTIQIFSDFQCPFCARVRPTIDRLLAAHPNDVRLVWRNYPLPFHQQADLAAEAAMEVYAQGGSAAFWRYHDVLFENQRALSREDLERYAMQLGGVDMARFRRALDQRTHRASVQAEIAAVTASGARIGTPSFFINGRLLQGAQPYEAFEGAVQRALQAP
jgi:protein-disulfide isomerase